MAHTKSKGSSKLGRDSKSKRLGVKLFGSQKVSAGQIIIRQRGTKFFPGENVRRGADDTLYAASSGLVAFQAKKLKKFDGNFKRSQVVSVKAAK